MESAKLGSSSKQFIKNSLYERRMTEKLFTQQLTPIKLNTEVSGVVPNNTVKCKSR